MKRPALHEPDTWSYLDGSLTIHVVRGRRGAGWYVDGSPDFMFESGTPEPDPACRDCAYEWARREGFTGPETLPIAYQTTLPPVDEDVLVFRIDGQLLRIASYAYGRAYFEPGEPRTTPCSRCGVETLRDWLFASADGQSPVAD